jgi:glycosyltransferase involved in cell wall biosynthesis
MNVAIVFFLMGVGGIQRKIIDLVEILSRNQSVARVSLILKTRENFNYLNRLDHHKLSLLIHEESLLFSHLPFWLFILVSLIRESPNSILAFLDYCSLTSLAYKRLVFWRRIKVILCEDALTTGYTRDYQDPMFLWFIRKLYPWANRIICPSRAISQQLAQDFFIPKDRLQVIPNWTHFKPSGKHYLPKYDLLFAGRFEPQKNLTFLIKAFSKINRKLPQATLVLIGGGSEETRLRRLVSDLRLTKRVTFRRPTHKIQSVIEQTKVFVMTSRYEGMSLVALESLALGVPVVSLTYPGAEDIISPGENGYIARGQTEFVRYCLLCLKRARLRARLGKQAQKIAQDRFSISHAHTYVTMLLD